MSVHAVRLWLRRSVWLVSVYGLLIALLLYERLIRSSAFSSFDVQSLVDGTLPLALAAMAQACVVLAGGIDLSVGSVITLANVVAANWMLNASFGPSLAMSLAIVIGGAVIGVLTALAINITHVPDIIVTLATSAIWGGAALQVMPTPGGGVPQRFADFLTGDVGSSAVPVGIVVLALTVLLVWLPIRRTRPGLAIYAVGSNRAAAFLSGVSVARTRVVAYALGGVFSALSGLVLTAQTSNGSASSGASYTLNSVAAIVIGGVALTGGRGGMMGPIAAAFILTLISNILGYLNVDPNYASVIQGVVVVLAVMVGGVLLRPAEVKRYVAIARRYFIRSSSARLSGRGG
jgi:ribose transport system permease protein